MSLPPTTQSQILRHYLFFYKVTQLCPPLCNPMDYTVHGILQARILESPFPSPGDLPNPGIEPRSPSLHMDSLPAVNPSFRQQIGVAGTQERATMKGTISSSAGTLHGYLQPHPARSGGALVWLTLRQFSSTVPALK